MVAVGGDLLLRRTATHERWRRSGFSLTAPAIWLSLSLLTVWFLSHCSGVRWRRSGVEKGGGYLVIDINYFTGYEKLPCYETVMTDFFLNLMKSHTVEKTTTDFDRPSDWIRRRRCRLMYNNSQTMDKFLVLTIYIVFVLLATLVSAQDCGRQGGNRGCTNGNCCSQFGFCGNTPAHCSPANNCQSQCSGTPQQPSGGVGSIITPTVFDQMLKYRNDPRCQANGFYTYNAFITAAAAYNGFGTTGSAEVQRRELAAFLAQTSHETTGGWPSAPDGPYAWGYCFVREQDQSNNYCSSSAWPCTQKYFGRGPIQLSHNYNYGLFGRSVGRDLINNPDLLATDPTLSFRSAIWFWMTPQDNKPSSHDVITGRWTPSAADNSAGRVPGFGVITNIINGGLECGRGQDNRVQDRIGFYTRYCSILGVSPGNNLDCNNQRPFA
ncbi:hypothetical protein L6452_40087 [Arctium lappa]|uniref:Uncharacterized protein n=1 Tax=Arctium lappa TaxID=4217 RepID=A0ACB8XLR1_ARCLA|nr:hypothetical protein L6452_40087 [Arctium lappa]